VRDRQTDRQTDRLVSEQCSEEVDDVQSSRVYAVDTVRPAHQQVHLQAAYTMHHAYCKVK